MGNDDMLGRLAWWLGGAGAILVGLLVGLNVVASTAMINLILASAGAIIGWRNVVMKEAVAFMVASGVIAAGAGALSFVPVLGAVLGAILLSVALVAGTAAVVVGFRVFLDTAN